MYLQKSTINQKLNGPTLRVPRYAKWFLERPNDRKFLYLDPISLQVAVRKKNLTDVVVFCRRADWGIGHMPSSSSSSSSSSLPLGISIHSTSSFGSYGNRRSDSQSRTLEEKCFQLSISHIFFQSIKCSRNFWVLPVCSISISIICYIYIIYVIDMLLCIYILK